MLKAVQEKFGVRGSNLKIFKFELFRRLKGNFYFSPVKN